MRTPPPGDGGVPSRPGRDASMRPEARGSARRGGPGSAPRPRASGRRPGRAPERCRCRSRRRARVASSCLREPVG